jgi:hypothetical protein
MSRDVVVDLPPGLIGNPTAVPQCTLFPAQNERLLMPLAIPVSHGPLSLAIRLKTFLLCTMFETKMPKISRASTVLNER